MIKILLNSKSILECNEQEEKIHNKEIENIVDIIQTFPNYNCAILFKYKDKTHKHLENKILQGSLHDFLSNIEYVDFKNGIDLKLGDNNLLTIIAYGQNYYINNEFNNVITEIIIMPYNNDEDREFLDISFKLLSSIKKASSIRCSIT